MRSKCEPTWFGDESRRIIHGDALSELKKLPSESVDLIFADPPITSAKILMDWLSPGMTPIFAPGCLKSLLNATAF